MNAEPIIYIIEDNADHREIVSQFVIHAGFAVRVYESGTEFFDDPDIGVFGCILLDNMLPRMTGLEVQAELIKKNNHLPIIFISGGSDIPVAVEAVKRGAMGFLEKPIKSKELIEHVTAAVEECRRRLAERETEDALQNLLVELTDRERDVYDRVVLGKTNKMVANELSISIGTVEFHRANMMRKLNVQSFSELMALSTNRPKPPGMSEE